MKVFVPSFCRSKAKHQDAFDAVDAAVEEQQAESGTVVPPPESTFPHGESWSGKSDKATKLYSSSRLGLTRGQLVLVVLLLVLVAAIGLIGIRANRIVTDKAEVLQFRLEFVSSDSQALQRQAHRYALTVHHWADGDVSDGDREVARSLLERQLRVSVDDGFDGDIYERRFAVFIDELEALDELTAQDRGQVDNDQLIAATAGITRSVGNVTDITEAHDVRLSSELLDALDRSRQAQRLGSGLTAILILGLVFSVLRMMRRNFNVAKNLIEDDRQQLESVRAESLRLENRYSEVVDHVSDVVFRADDQGRWVWVNEAFATLTGVSPDEVVGRRAAEICPPDARDIAHQSVIDFIESGESELGASFTVLRPDGSERQAVVQVRAATDEESGRRYLAGTITDITDRVRGQRKAGAQREIFRLVALDRPLSEVLGRLVSLMAELVPGSNFRFICDDDTPAKLSETAEQGATDSIVHSGTRRLTGVGGQGLRYELRWAKTGEVTDDAHLSDVVDLAAQLGTLALDREAAALEISHRANHDELTSLANRNRLVDEANKAIDRAKMSGGGLAVMFLDIDRFKMINDSLGHKAGDELLVGFAGRLHSVVRSEDTVARFGGDEFVILFESADTTQAIEIARRILESVRRPFAIGEKPTMVSTSIGIVVGDGGSDIDDLLKQADQAMYRAKQNGRDRYELFDAAFQEWADHRREIQNALQGAVGRGELEVYYQPLFDLPGRRFRGFEALARWNRPVEGLTQPGEFIEIAEELGMVGEIDQYVLSQVVRQVADWRRYSDKIWVGVNFSGDGLSQPGFLDLVRSSLAATGTDGRGIVIEITESVLVVDTETLVNNLAGLKAMGFNVAIDDFGTGYSSLQYLRKLPVDILKIDRGFVSDVNVDYTVETDLGIYDRTIVESVTELGHALGLSVVAEGIETERQLNELQAMGIDVGQGYVLGKPAPVVEATEKVAFYHRLNGPASKSQAVG